jgi:hypothetical protein
MATADGNKKINRKIGSSSRNEYPACDTPIHMFAAAATNQMTTNATVAVIIDEVLELARSFATPRHAAHRTNPTAMMMAVRMDYLPSLAPDRRDGCRNITVGLTGGLSELKDVAFRITTVANLVSFESPLLLHGVQSTAKRTGGHSCVREALNEEDELDRGIFAPNDRVLDRDRVSYVLWYPEDDKLEDLRL